MLQFIALIVALSSANPSDLDTAVQQSRAIRHAGCASASFAGSDATGYRVTCDGIANDRSMSFASVQNTVHMPSDFVIVVTR